MSSFLTARQHIKGHSVPFGQDQGGKGKGMGKKGNGEKGIGEMGNGNWGSLRHRL